MLQLLVGASANSVHSCQWERMQAEFLSPSVRWGRVTNRVASGGKNMHARASVTHQDASTISIILSLHSNLKITGWVTWWSAVLFRAGNTAESLQKPSLIHWKYELQLFLYKMRNTWRKVMMVDGVSKAKSEPDQSAWGSVRGRRPSDCLPRPQSKA